MSIHRNVEELTTSCQPVATGVVFRPFKASCDDYKIHGYREHGVTVSPFYQRTPKQSSRNQYIAYEIFNGFYICKQNLLTDVPPFAKKFTPLRMQLRKPLLEGFSYHAWATYSEAVVFPGTVSANWDEAGSLNSPLHLAASTPAIDTHIATSLGMTSSGIGMATMDMEYIPPATPCDLGRFVFAADLTSLGLAYDYLAGMTVHQAFTNIPPGPGHFVGWSPFWTGVHWQHPGNPPSISNTGLVLSLQLNIQIFNNN